MNNENEQRQTWFDLPATRGPELLSLLKAIDPVCHPDSEKRYRERPERFCQNLRWRRITGDVAPRIGQRGG